MRVLGWLGFLALCLGLAGCSSLGKKTSLPKTAKDDRPGPAAPRDEGPALPSPVVPAAGTGGMIAGRVGDVFNANPPADIFIIPPGDGQGAPVVQRAETDRNGYFTIQNLQPGVTYRVVAQTKDGQYRQAGEVTARPPNSNVYVLVKPDNRPTIPGVGGDSGLRPSIGAPQPITEPPPRVSPVTPGAPIPMTDPGATSGSVTPIQPENFAGSNARPNRDSMPANMNNPFAPRPPAAPPPKKPTLPLSIPGGPPLPEPGLSPISAVPVPSCDLRGKQLYNLALAGLDGQVWQYKRDRLPGTKLTMLDFWGTWCVPCRITIKNHLNGLHSLYGRQGLEIVGIAYEQEPTYAAQVRTVEAARRELGINYRLLMGFGMTTCPVKRDFEIKGFPTLVLLNDKGQIIWQKEGVPNEPEFDQLKVIIRKELGIR